MLRLSPTTPSFFEQSDTRVSPPTQLHHLGLTCALMLLLSGCYRSNAKPSTPVVVAPTAMENAGPPQADLAEAPEVNRPGPTEDPSALKAEELQAEELQAEELESKDSKMVEDDAQAEWMNGTWTTQRLLALSPGGPTLIDLSINVDGKSLEQATEDATQAIANELFEGLMKDNEQPVTWTELLAHPLVKSGWLGNLVAAEEQESQLVGMYDTQRDDMVTQAELAPFLSRGLARNEPLQISDIGNAPNAEVNQSPWGPADQDSDHTLDEKEVGELASILSELDYNGDDILSVQELRQEQDMLAPTQSMGRASLLETNTLVVASGVFADDIEEASKARRRLSSRILDHYTFLEGIPRAQWSRWHDQRWQLLDTNQDGLLVRAELELLSSIPSDVRLMVRFPSLESTDGTLRVFALPSEKSLEKKGEMVAASSTPKTWQESPAGGQLRVAGLLAQVQIQDAFSTLNRNQLKQLLENALTTPQLRNFVTAQFQLQEGAFDLLDRNMDLKLDDEEFARVWRWLSARQGTRLLVRWMVAANPWFSLWDRNGDERLTAIETRNSPDFFRELDENHDGRLVPSELPLVVRMEFERADSRLAAPFGLGNESPIAAEDSDWFAAMDTNRDGYIGKTEFLGEFEDFATLDLSKDGFLSRSEVYGPNGKH